VALFLLFQLGADRYALDAGLVDEVLPLMAVKAVPRAPIGVAGILDYRGTPVPVIDVSQIALGRPAQHRLSTRLLIIRYVSAAGAVRPLGLIVEQATETFQRDPADFVDSGLTPPDAAYLGGVATDPYGPVQRIDLQNLLPAAVQDALFRTAGQP
jgi:chemotaxis-related protein WspB